jgi:hypothetical protein
VPVEADGSDSNVFFSSMSIGEELELTLLVDMMLLGSWYCSSDSGQYMVRRWFRIYDVIMVLHVIDKTRVYSEEIYGESGEVTKKNTVGKKEKACRQ